MYANIQIDDVINILGIEVLGANSTEYKALCPFCGDEKGHLYINHIKGLYKCHRCGEQGNALTLYAKVNNISNSEAYKELTKNEYISNNKVLYSKKTIQEAKEVEIEVRDKTYNALLDMLVLTKEHYQNLLQRGLTIEKIKEKKYKSLEMDYEKRKSICQQLIKNGIQLEGVPGFYIDKNGMWNFYSNESTGILIPSRNIKGQIQGMQIRLDNVQSNKYRNFTSSNKYRGTKAKNYIHVINKNSKKVIITEGILKSDVSAEMSNTTFIGLVGVNSYSGITEILKEIIKNGNKDITIAYDMDKYSNNNVLKAEKELIEHIKENLKITVKILEWDRNFKGIDDYLYYLVSEKAVREK